MTAEIIGFCRFSFFGPSDTQLSYDDKEQAFRTLYAQDRMETRFLLFENLLLPSLRGQLNQNFRLFVLSSACMPEPYKEKLKALCKTVPQITLIFAETSDLGAVVNPIIKAPELDAKGLVQFRIDDDDALSQNYIERLHYWSEHLPGRIFVTFPNGLMVCDSDGQAVVHPMHRRMTAVGLALSTKASSNRSILTIPHIKAGFRSPSICDPGFHAYIQTFTRTTDTSIRAHRKINQFLSSTGVAVGSEAAEQRVETCMHRDFPFTNTQDVLEVFRTADAKLENH